MIWIVIVRDPRKSVTLRPAETPPPTVEVVKCRGCLVVAVVLRCSAAAVVVVKSLTVCPLSLYYFRRFDSVRFDRPSSLGNQRTNELSYTHSLILTYSLAVLRCVK